MRNMAGMTKPGSPYDRTPTTEAAAPRMNVRAIFARLGEGLLLVTRPWWPAALIDR